MHTYQSSLRISIAFCFNSVLYFIMQQTSSLTYRNSILLEKLPQLLTQQQEKQYSPTFRTIMRQAYSKIFKQKLRSNSSRLSKHQLPLIDIKMRYKTVDKGKSCEKSSYLLRISSIMKKNRKHKEVSLSLQPKSVIQQRNFRKKQIAPKIVSRKRNKTDGITSVHFNHNENALQFLQKSIKLDLPILKHEGSPPSVKNVKKFKFYLKQKLKSPQRNKAEANPINNWQPWSTSQQTAYLI